MRVYSIVINNLSTAMTCGEVLKQGTLGLVVDRIPDAGIFHWVGRHLVCNSGGVYRHFTYDPRDGKGFAGRTIVLRVKEKGKVFSRKTTRVRIFKGTLWDTYGGKKACEDFAGCEVVEISLRNSSSRYDVFCGGFLMSRKDVEEKLSHLLVFDTPTMNPEIVF